MGPCGRSQRVLTFENICETTTRLLRVRNRDRDKIEMRWLLLLGVAGLMLIPVGTHALSLGSLELRSSLHQPLNARVPILSATADEIETLNVRVASPEQFARAGVKYAAVLTQLTFEIQQTRKGPDYIL